MIIESSDNLPWYNYYSTPMQIPVSLIALASHPIEMIIIITRCETLWLILLMMCPQMDMYAFNGGVQYGTMWSWNSTCILINPLHARRTPTAKTDRTEDWEN